MNRLRALSILLALLFAMPAAAQEEGIGSIQIKPGVCTTAKAQTVTLAALVATPDAFDGLCVRVEGVVAGAMLYSDRAGYEQAMGREGRGAGRIGLYGDEAILGALPVQPTSMELVGEVSQCAGRPFLRGYCHYVAEGVILIASEARKIAR